MYCPKCSQQQLSEELRFCSRCGFSLIGVAMLLENNGALPIAPPQKGNVGRRRQIIKESVLFTLGSWIVMFVGILLWDWGGWIEAVAKVGSLIFFLLGLIGVLRFLYAFLFVKGDERPAQPAFPTAPQPAALPSPQAMPLSDYPLRSNTREMVPRDSVTEGTTRLLDEK